MGKLLDATLEQIKEYCDRNVFQAATAPLKEGVAFAIYVDHAGPVTMVKKGNRMTVVDEAPTEPDITAEIPGAALEELLKQKTEEVGELGVALLKAMSDADAQKKIRVKVHIGLLTFVFHGYFGILPLGGPTVMKFLSEKGFTSLSKIKEAISALRSSK